jgi:hypothetical protein
MGAEQETPTQALVQVQAQEPSLAVLTEDAVPEEQRLRMLGFEEVGTFLAEPQEPPVLREAVQ